MPDLAPTPDLIATARRVAGRDWTVEHDEDAFGPDMDANLRRLVDAGLVVLYLPPTRLTPDHWTLTDAGQKWLTKHDSRAA